MADAPRRCPLCGTDDVRVRKVLRRFIIACHGCGAKLAYTPQPSDNPALAGRIELLIEPQQSARTRLASKESE
jgi:hypothetical protein